MRSRCLLPVLFALALPTAADARMCGKAHYGSHAATVTIVRGKVSCREAKRVARRLLSGNAAYHDGGYSYNSYYLLGHGWKGGTSTGGWGATNKRRHAYITGDVLS